MIDNLQTQQYIQNQHIERYTQELRTTLAREADLYAASCLGFWYGCQDLVHAKISGKAVEGPKITSITLASRSLVPTRLIIEQLHQGIKNLNLEKKLITKAENLQQLLEITGRAQAILKKNQISDTNRNQLYKKKLDEVIQLANRDEIAGKIGVETTSAMNFLYTLEISTSRKIIAKNLAKAQEKQITLD